MTQKLSPKLLHNLEKHYSQVTLMWSEGLDFEQAAPRIGVTHEELEDMHIVIFNQHPVYTVNNIFGDEFTCKFNAANLQSTLMEKEHEAL